MLKQLKQKATNAFIWDMAGVFAKQGVAFFVSIFLARLLLPGEFGLVAMALVFISISQVFADFGLASALIQNKDNTSLTYSSVFYFNIAVGVLLFMLFWLVAPFIGQFYGNEEISTLVRYLSFNFIISSFNQIQQTILRKNIEFKKIAIRASISQVASGVLAIVLAYRGWGVYALVVQNLVGSFLGTLLLWQVAEWKPRLEFSWTEVKKLRGFSVYVFLSYVATRIVAQLDTLIVGKVFSANTLGLYSRASSLNSLVTTFSSASISKISFPLMSQLQNDHDRFVYTYFKMLELVAFTSFGLSGALIFAGADIITLLFGENWTASIFIFQILVLKSFTYPVSLLIISVFWASGKSKESFWFGNIGKIITLLPLAVAMVWGFNPFLYAVVIAAILNWILSNWFIAFSFNISFLRQCKVIALYFVMFVAIALLIYLINQNFIIVFPFSGIITGIVFSAIYIAVNFLLKTPGYIDSIEYIKPIWTQVLNRLKGLTKSSE
jgi:O-antigen/teichoic acid export membrane protein